MFLRSNEILETIRANFRRPSPCSRLLPVHHNDTILGQRGFALRAQLFSRLIKRWRSTAFELLVKRVLDVILSATAVLIRTWFEVLRGQVLLVRGLGQSGRARGFLLVRSALAFHASWARLTLIEDPDFANAVYTISNPVCASS
jgi:hypothetical protein